MNAQKCESVLIFTLFLLQCSEENSSLFASVWFLLIHKLWLNTIQQNRHTMPLESVHMTLIQSINACWLGHHNKVLAVQVIQSHLHPHSRLISNLNMANVNIVTLHRYARSYLDTSNNKVAIWLYKNKKCSYFHCSDNISSRPSKSLKKSQLHVLMSFLIQETKTNQMFLSPKSLSFGQNQGK